MWDSSPRLSRRPTPLTVAHSLYREAFTADTLEEVRKIWARLARELNRLSALRDTPTEQLLALRLSIRELQRKANALYYVEGGWHERMVADQPPRAQGLWLFLAKDIRTSEPAETARDFRIEDTGVRKIIRPKWHASILSLWVPTPDTHITVALQPWLTTFGGKADYAGPAQDLFEWAGRKLLLVHRVDVLPSTSH